MRASIIIILAFAAGIIVATPRTRNYSHFVKLRGKLVAIDPFTPRTMATSINFGKRQSIVDPPKITKHERILFTLLRYFPQGISVEWLLQQIKTNPTFATKLAQLLMNERTDLMSMVDRSNPERTTWLF